MTSPLPVRTVPTVRAVYTLPVSLLVGFGVGFFVFRGPGPLATSSVAAQGRAENRTSTSAGFDSAEDTSTKAQRLIAAALRNGRDLERNNDLYLAVEALTADDFRRLLGDLGAVKAMIEKVQHIGAGTGNILIGALINRWLEVDPEKVMTWAPRVVELIPAREQSRSFILEALAKKRPEQLLELAATRKDPAERAEFIAPALRELTVQNAAKARAWLERCTDPADREAAEKAIREGTVQADPLRAVELAAACKNRDEALGLMVRAKNQASQMGRGILRQLATTPMPGWMLAPIFNDISQREPELAVDLVLQGNQEVAERGGMGLSGAFTYLARSDLEKAKAKLNSVPEGMRANAMSGIAFAWIATDPAATFAWLAGLPEAARINSNQSAHGTNDILFTTYASWANQNPNGARDFADALPPGEMRDGMQTQLARAMASQDRLAEATNILGQLGSKADPKALADIAQAWTRQDPQAAADWAIAQPAGPQQSQALASVVSTWANDNPRAAGEWLAQFPPGEVRDRSVAAYLRRQNMWKESPETQLAEFDTWFDTIEDPWQRAVVARSFYWTKKRSNSAEARTWLSSLPKVDAEVVRRTLRQN